MKDIANKIGVSRCTVSNVLNNRLDGKSYRKETIELVRKTATEMGYISNSMARALKTGSSQTIAVVVPDIANTFYIKIIKEIERRANAMNYSLIICMAEEILEKENAVLRMLQSRCVDGVLISPVSFSESLQENYPYKIVCLDRTVTGDRFPCIKIDNYTAGYELCAQIIRDGARRPLFLAGSKEDHTIEMRFNGICAALNDQGLTFPQGHAFMDIFEEDAAYRIVAQAIGQGMAFDSILLSTNYLIYGVLHALKDFKRDLVSIGGFEDFYGKCLSDKRIHIIHQHEELLANRAFDTLIRLLRNESVESCTVPFSLV